MERNEGGIRPPRPATDGRGDSQRLDELFEAAYDELRRAAHLQRRQWEGNHSLESTVLVHEAYLRLVRQSALEWQDRGHFLAAAALAMRHIMIDYARARRAKKRGGDRARLSLKSVESWLSGGPLDSDFQDEAVLAVAHALERLEAVSPRQARIVDCRFFAGLTIEDTAEAVGVSPATVKRDQALAQAWLFRDLVQSSTGEPSGGSTGSR